MLPDPGVASAINPGDAALFELAQRRFAQIGMRCQEVVEVALGELDQVRGKDRGDRRGAPGVGKERGLAEEVAGHEVREHDLLVAGLLGDLHHPVPDQVEGIGLVALAEDLRVLAEVLHDGFGDQLAEKGFGDAGEEIAAERAEEEGLIDECLGAWRVREQFQDRLAGDLQHARHAHRFRCRGAAAAGDEAHLPEEIARGELGDLHFL